LALRGSVVGHADLADQLRITGMAGGRDRHSAWRAVKRRARVVAQQNPAEQSVFGRADDEQVSMMGIRQLMESLPGGGRREATHLGIDVRFLTRSRDDVERPLALFCVLTRAGPGP